MKIRCEHAASRLKFIKLKFLPSELVMRGIDGRREHADVCGSISDVALLSDIGIPDGHFLYLEEIVARAKLSTFILLLSRSSQAKLWIRIRA